MARSGTQVALYPPMKPASHLVPALFGGLLLIGCGNHQQTQAVGQRSSQPSAGDQSAATQQAQARSPAQAEAVPSQAPPAVEPSADTSTAQSSNPPAGWAPAPSDRAGDARASDHSGPAEFSIPAGTTLDVRLEQTIDTNRNRPGDRFQATLASPLVVNGQAVIPRGTRFAGHLIESRPSGRLKGHAELSLSLDSFDLNGRRYDIKTAHVARASRGHKKRNWTLIGGGSGLGTALGAIAGGPAGALIGAGAGAGAGTAGAVLTGKKNVRLPVETPLAFRLREPISIGS